MPPLALISSTAIFMPLETGTPQTLIGPDKSWWVPMTISLAETPSLVTLVWAAAGSWVSARALTARPNALNDFDIAISSLLARDERRLGPSQSFAVFKIPLRGRTAYATARSPYMASISTAYRLFTKLRFNFMVGVSS